MVEDTTPSFHMLLEVANGFVGIECMLAGLHRVVYRDVGISCKIKWEFPKIGDPIIVP